MLEGRMIKVSVLYPAGEGNTFDMDYYMNSHTPLLQRLLGDSLKQISVDVGLRGAMPGTPAPYVVMCDLTFESVEAYEAVFAAHGMTLMADIPNYTNIRPVMQVSETKL
jgi:uncharacterized protein (TIGR02118 family)